MQTIDGQPVYAATDLVGYLACEHLTQLERAAMAGMTRRPERDDPELDIIRKRGFEQRFLDDLRAEGKSVASIELDGSIEDRGDQLRAAAAATRDALAQGPDGIYQATLKTFERPDSPSVPIVGPQRVTVRLGETTRIVFKKP